MNLFARVINGFEIKDTSSPNKIRRQVKASKEKNYGKILESLWLIEKNDFAQSRTLLAEAIEESRRGESWEEEYASLSVLMICEAENQRIKEAEQLNQQTEYLDTVMQKKGVNRDNIWIALNKFAQGLILEKKPNIEHSILFYESALLLFDEVHVDYYQQRLFQKLGEFHEQVGNYNIALSYLHQQIYASLDEIKPNSPIRIYESIANIHIEKGQYDIALYYLQSSINILDNLNQKDDFHINLRALLQQQVGRIYISIGNLDQAIYYLELSSTVFQDQDDQKQLGWATMQLGLTNHKKGFLEKPISSYEPFVAIFQNL
ncbi:MAG: tetratricopeptide repeat protein, partial [Candidatus Heimdallarchaeota archaeon]|nr:tetratricopeptide repeat protein [Candidatus Heimdallarchaeota archaeon]